VPDLLRYHSLLVDAIDACEADAHVRIHVRYCLEKELLAYRMTLVFRVWSQKREPT